MRRIFIGFNWKMNKTTAQAAEFMQTVLANNLDNSSEVVLFAPFTDLWSLSKQLSGTGIKVGAQNMHHLPQGAFTGEISPVMLSEIGIEYVIIGHSERRQYFNETDEAVNVKVKAALEHGLKPVVCVGETAEQRENGLTEELVISQVGKALDGIESDQVEKVIIAYEPIWSISTFSTGKTATAEDANDACALIRSAIEKKYGYDIAQKITILFGGSVNSKNAKELFDKEHVDGGLVGGASLNPDEFIQIINYEG